MAAEVQRSEREEFPERSSRNPERRQRQLVERRENAPEREIVKRERTIDPGLSNIKAEAKAYLRSTYCNDNGRLICQCCRDPMPFRLPKTDHDFFEAVQFIRDRDQRFYENYLALCPTCSAKYQHACQTDHEEIRNLLIAANPDGKTPVDIDLVLAGKPETLRFVAVHALDLKIILK